MRIFKNLFHFLGGIYFALFLIGMTAAFVIAGTIIESSTDSHLHAANYIYSNPLFKALLWMFFVCILFAALRRRPFKKHHIPFLLTHLGLLMILGGTLIKSYFGTQGSLSIMEGAESHSLYVPDSYALQITRRGDHSLHRPQSELIEFERNILGKLTGTLEPAVKTLFPELSIKLLDLKPHSQTQWQMWIKDNCAIVHGLPPLPIRSPNPYEETILPSAKAPLSFDKNVNWTIYAIKADNMQEVLRKIYTQSATLIVQLEGETQLQVPLVKAIHNPQRFEKGTMQTDLVIEDIRTAELVCSLNQTKIHVPLNGMHALLNQRDVFNPLDVGPSLTIDLECSPTLILVQDSPGVDHLILITSKGELYSETFKADALQSLYVYDRGFSGYGIKAHLPFDQFTPSRKTLETALNIFTADQMLQFLEDSQALPVLHPLFNACKECHVDFENFWPHFISSWQQHPSWLYPENIEFNDAAQDVLNHVNLGNLSPKILNGVLWAKHFFQVISSQEMAKTNLLLFLEKTNWPLLEELKQEVIKEDAESDDILFYLTRQLFSIGELLKSPPSHSLSNLSVQDKATLISLLLRLSGFDPTLPSLLDLDEKKLILKKNAPGFDVQSQVLSCPISRNLSPLPSLKKWENCQPLLKLEITFGDQKEVVEFPYDRFATDLKWPILNGRYLVRFQSLFQPLPYNVRLRDARQINYPGTNQAYSYESDLIISDRRENSLLPTEVTISMNEVHETRDGYRFYMASLAPSSEVAAQRAQIVVNHDPGKYYLTYPGAVILSIGILLLFWWKPKKKGDNH